ncbi:MAG: hypothetical protein LBB79_03950 [Prevotellaceae bacterium]|nr:hypothetical protein [Prevotellaceae bacterium]
MAAAIGKDKPTVRRGLKRTANRKGAYSLEHAQGVAELRKERSPKKFSSDTCMVKRH